MKQNLFFFLLLGFLSTQAQNFAPVGTRWHYDVLNEPRTFHQEYYSEKDTQYQGRSCRKIMHTYVFNGHPIDTLDDIYISNGTDTVFYYNTIYSRFFPLYIYNVSEGDILTFHSPDVPANLSDTLLKVYVESIVYVKEGNDSFKSYTLEALNGNYEFVEQTERIGQFFRFLHGRFASDHGDIRCYDDGTHVFTTGPCEYIDSSTGSTNSAENQISISIYPNPVSEILLVETSAEETAYTIVDALGKLAGSGILNTEKSIPVNYLPQGIYIIEFTTKNFTQRLRFVITR